MAQINQPSGALGTLRFQEVYPGLKSQGVDVNSPTSTASASGGTRAPAGPATAPAMVLVTIVLVLVAVRVLYEMAPEGGRTL